MSALPAIRNASFLASAEDARDLPPPLFAEVAFAGKSNVGKSSLINSLLGRKKLARTSSTPGRTRTLNLIRAELTTGTFDIVDLPGYGYAKVSKSERRSWGPMIERFLRERAGLRCVVLIIDIRRGLADDDRQLLEFLHEIGRDALLVGTKLDKLGKSAQRPALQALQREAKPYEVLGFSAETEQGKDELWRAMLQRCGIAAG
jgi:GTP-binding protein